MDGLEGRHAVVTGGGTGIGLAIADRLASHGARVTIASRNLERLTAACRDLENVTAIALDVTREESVEAAFLDLGDVDILVNNAGAALTAPFHKTSLENWSAMLDVNLTGAFLCVKAVLPGMRDRNSGRIVTVASSAGLKGYAYTAAYTAAKHGVIGMTRALAMELAMTGITANCVCPGFADTDIVTNAVANITAKTGRSEEEALAELVKHNPQKRLISPAEVAAAVAWLCAPESASITGQAVSVAGGEIM